MAGPLPTPATVFGLLSSGDGRLRYVGQTTGLPEWRLSGLMRSAKIGVRGPLVDWMREELAAGHSIKLQIIVDCGTLNVTAPRIIEALRAEGCDLLDTRKRATPVPHDGTITFGAEHNRRIAQAAAKRRHSDDTRDKIGRGVRRARRARGEKGLVAALA